MKIKNEIVLITLSVLAILICSCSSLNGLLDSVKAEEEPYVESEEEKAIEYPYSTEIEYNGRVAWVTVMDSNYLRLSFLTPRANIDYEYAIDFMYKMRQELLTFPAKNSPNQQVCGIELEVERADGRPGGYIEFCRRGDFAEGFANKLNYSTRKCRDKTHMRTFLMGEWKFESAAVRYDPFYHAPPKLIFSDKRGMEFTEGIEKELQ